MYKQKLLRRARSVALVWCVICLPSDDDTHFLILQASSTLGSVVILLLELAILIPLQGNTNVDRYVILL
jgi:hypothetical protein